jgi:SAM-dependent methyltransferase
MFEQWNAILDRRIQYYTKTKSIAGLMANYSYRSLRKFQFVNTDKWLLDVGCGDGSQIAYLKDRSRYIGVDTNLKRLEILKAKYPDVTAIWGDAANLPLRSESIKYIFSCNAFEHLWYLKDSVFEIFRCIAKDGLSIIVIPTEGGLWNLGRALISRPYFRKHYPDIDFDYISRLEHCNNAKQILRTVQTFFHTKVRYLPLRMPTVLLNAYLEIQGHKKQLDFKSLSEQSASHSKKSAQSRIDRKG